MLVAGKLVAVGIALLLAAPSGIAIWVPCFVDALSAHYPA